MAKKFFKTRVYNRRKNIILISVISICVVLIIVLFIITSNLTKQNKQMENAVIDIKDVTSVELFGDFPEKEMFFKTLEGVELDDIDIDKKEVNLEKAGTYDITITIFNKDYDVSLKVVDIDVPILKTKEVHITSGESYTANMFVEECSDNSKEECNIKFDTDSSNQAGELIDYSRYVDPGTYEIKIIASDSSNNITEGITKLVIDNKVTTVTCNYGNLDYNGSYILTLNVGVNNCALDLNLYQSTSLKNKVIEISDTELSKLKLDIEKITNLVDNITINRTVDPILNSDGTGLVGYSLFLEATDARGDVIVSYFLSEDGSRIYVENPHKIK